MRTKVSVVPPRAVAKAVATMGLLAVWTVSLAGCGNSLSNSFTTLEAPQIETASAGLSSDPKKRNIATTRAAEKLTASSTPGNQGYKIGPQDTLDFSVYKAQELQRSVQVSETGTINLPLIGEVQAAGRTSQELEREVTAKLGKKYLQKPLVTIVVREYNSQRVTLEGAIKKPGVYPLRGKTTLLQLVAMADGLGDVSDSTVVIFRQANGQKTAAKFDISAIRSGAAADPALQAGDTIVAPTSAMKETFSVILKALPLATVFALI